MSYNSVIAADSPVAWWRLDENSGATSVTDSSGNGHTGTVTPVVTFGAGGQPAGMTGPVSSWTSDANQNISFTSYQPSFANGSWELWYNQNGTSAGTNPRILGDNNNGAIDGFDFLLNGKNTPVFSAGNGTVNATITASSPLNAGWHHIVITYDGAHLNMYVDSVLAASAVALTGTILPHGTNFVRIGGNFPWESHDPFSGLLCQVALYSTALSAARVTAHYNAGITASSPGGDSWLFAAGIL